MLFGDQSHQRFGHHFHLFLSVEEVGAEADACRIGPVFPGITSGLRNIPAGEKKQPVRGMLNAKYIAQQKRRGITET